MKISPARAAGPAIYPSERRRLETSAKSGSASATFAEQLAGARDVAGPLDEIGERVQ